jgi:Uma2 family endonuclease
MGMGNPEQVYYTADDVRALNEANQKWWPRYECVYGELLVSPAPATPHQVVISRLHARLSAYIEAQALPMMALTAPADISWGRDDVTVQPDAFVVPIAMLRESWDTRSWRFIRHLPLAAEVLSPSTRRGDRFTKRQLYQREGVPLYWILDPESRTAEVWTPEAHFPTIEAERLQWHPEDAAEPFVISLPELFAKP